MIPRTAMLLTALFFFVFVLCLLTTSCAGVKPWDRDVLAKPHMALDPHRLQSRLRAHVVESREAATGGGAAEGGGCGCN